MDSQSLIGETISSSTSNYLVEQILGSGSFGDVALCNKKPDNKLVALKIVRKKNLISFSIKEAALLNSLKHLGSEKFHIVEWSTAFLTNGCYCLEFERLDRSLQELIEEVSIPLGYCRPILHQLSEALHFLKVTGVVHADLKPENVMLVDQARQPLRVKLIDFGLAIKQPVKHTGSTFGTETYMSPEMLLGAPLDPAIDTWALGCVAAEMMTGYPLLNGDDEADMIRRIVSVIGKPPDSLISSGLNNIKYFRLTISKDLTCTWSLKCAEMSSDPDDPMSIRSLADLLKFPQSCPAEDVPAVECDRAIYVDLITRMLDVDPLSRITPAEILQHPFLTFSHLDRRHSSYLKSSMELMGICPGWSSSRQQPTSTLLHQGNAVGSTRTSQIGPTAAH